MINRVAVTQRVVSDSDYGERRDALAQDWVDWLSDVFPRAALLAAPNSPNQIESWFNEVNPNALILTGGNNWGDATERDSAETLLITLARVKPIPIFGVCRGMQVLNVTFGGRLTKDIGLCTTESHVVNQHEVTIVDPSFYSKKSIGKIQVNSFHNQGVTKPQVAEDLVVFAFTKDELVEGLYHKNEPILAVQWHPERSSPSAMLDEFLVKNLFEKGAFWNL